MGRQPQIHINWRRPERKATTCSPPTRSAFPLVATEQLTPSKATLKLTDENAEVAWMATYSAFGKTTILIEKVKQPLRFPGQYYDEESGLHPRLSLLRSGGQYYDEESGLCSNGFRYYDPELGRYIMQEPIGLAGGLNPYQYAPNSIRYIDPMGLSCKEALTNLSRQELIEQFGHAIGAGMFTSLRDAPKPETQGGLLEALLKPASGAICRRLGNRQRHG